MKAVLDTNVFVSGIHWFGKSYEVIKEWSNNSFELVYSEEIIEEIAKTLLNFKKSLSFDDLLWWISIIIGKGICVEPEEKIDKIKDDPDDNKFVETAVAGNAEYIVTQDKHLLKLKEFRGIKIIAPKEFLELIT